MENLVKFEPAVLTGAIAAVVTLAIAFGVPISVEQKAAILGVVAPVLALVQAFATRAAVVPAAKVDEDGYVQE